MQSTNSFQRVSLTLQDTQILKGIALLLLLCHHCLYTGKGYDDYMVGDRAIFQTIGVFCKLCVAIFVFLSGYGLTIGTQTKGGIGDIREFYRRRIVKLMLNYWLIYLLFVPLGVFVFHRTFSSVYGNDYTLAAISDFFGLHQAIMGHPMGYNPTWWFYGCIIALYLLYPLVWKCLRFWPVLLVFAFVFPTILSFTPILRTSGCDIYFLTFVCGAVIAYLRPCIIGGGRFYEIILLIIVFLICCIYRLYADAPIWWDAGITVVGVILYQNIKIPSTLSTVLSFLGKHSYNIFLFHTFIYALYFHDYIYWSRNPLVICLTLLAVCVPISMAIEWVKEKCGINILQVKLMGKK